MIVTAGATGSRSGVRAPLTDAELASVRRPFREASLLPARSFHDEAIWAFERDEWFYRDWICVGREEDAPEPGTYFLATLLDEPLVVVRGRDGALRAFYNVCRHRGTAVVEEERGSAVRFQCPYHAWVYDLEGRLVRAKHMDDIERFSPEAFGLVPVRIETWAGFVFVSLADEGPVLDEYLGDWAAHHEGFGREFGRLRRAGRLTYDVRANWKLIAENYSECYHCPGVHPLLNRLTPYDLGEDYEPLGPWKGGWMPLAAGCETMSMDGERHGRPLIAGTDAAAAGRIHYYLLWPNLIVSVHPDYVLTHVTWPDGPERSTVVCDLHVEEEALARGVDVSGALDFWDLTNRQDYHVVELQQRGTRSRSFTAGRYSNQEASVHAFDLMVADRYAADGVRTPRAQRTRAGGEARPVMRR